MEINIKLMTEEAYKTLQTNYEDVYKMLQDHPSDASWLKGYLGFEPYEEKKYVIEDFELEYDEDYSKVALNNAITIYEHLKNLPRYILCSNRFWAWITFEKAYKQSLKSAKIYDASAIKNMWLFTNNRRFMMLGVISRYFFNVEVSVDHSKTNKYELTDFLLKNTEIYRAISYRNVGMIKNVTLALIEVSKDISEAYNLKLNRPMIRSISIATSRIGSVMLIDIMSKEEIYNILYDKFKEIVLNERE